MKLIHIAQAVLFIIALLFFASSIFKFNLATEAATNEIKLCNDDLNRFANKEITEMPNCEYQGSPYRTSHLIGRSAVKSQFIALFVFMFALSLSFFFGDGKKENNLGARFKI